MRPPRLALVVLLLTGTACTTILGARDPIEVFGDAEAPRDSPSEGQVDSRDATLPASDAAPPLADARPDVATAQCASGLHLCDGACVNDLSTNTCGTACDPCPGVMLGEPTCDGRCDWVCAPGFAKCAAPYLCVDLAHDPGNCGTCGHGCASMTCVSGTCTLPDASAPPQDAP
jgi:hypothetical protein